MHTRCAFIFVLLHCFPISEWMRDKGTLTWFFDVVHGHLMSREHFVGIKWMNKQWELLVGLTLHFRIGNVMIAVSDLIQWQNILMLDELYAFGNYWQTALRNNYGNGRFIMIHLGNLPKFKHFTRSFPHFLAIFT